MHKDFSNLSIRSASWVGAQCVRSYCAQNYIESQYISEFCDFIESLAVETNISKWDERGRQLRVTGLGDPLPSELDIHENLKSLIETVREISASQIHGKWMPEYTNKFLSKAMTISGVVLSDQEYAQFASDQVVNDGWGNSVNQLQLTKWQHLFLARSLAQ